MSSEAKVVRENFDYLVNEVASDLLRIARKAYEKRLVTQAILETASNSAIDVKDRATGLVSAIQRKIKVNKETFESFLEILREEQALMDAAATLENARRAELEKGAARDRERSTCGGNNLNKEGATAREGDSGVAGLSVTSNYSKNVSAQEVMEYLIKKSRTRSKILDLFYSETNQLYKLNPQHNELRQERDHLQGQLKEARRHAEESDKKRRESDVALITSE